MRTLSKMTSEVQLKRIPILSSSLPMETPGRSRSTIKADRPMIPAVFRVEARTV